MRTRSLKTNGVRSAKVVCPSCKWTCRRKSLKEAPKVMAYLLTWTKAGMKYNANSVYKFFFLGWKIMRRQHHASPWFLPRLKLAWSLTGRAPLRYWGDDCLGSFSSSSLLSCVVIIELYFLILWWGCWIWVNVWNVKYGLRIFKSIKVLTNTLPKKFKPHI